MKDSIYLEPQFGTSPLRPRIVARGVNNNKYKPVYFKTEREMMLCLKEFGIDSLREFGNPVEWLDDADVSILKKWKFLKEPYTSKKAETLLFYRDVLSEVLDEFMLQNGFKRSSKSICYKKKLRWCKQRFDCTFRSIHLDVTGELYPAVYSDLDELKPIVKRVFGCKEDNIIDIYSSFCWNWPSHLKTAEEQELFHFYDKDSLKSAMRLIKGRLEADLFPLLNIFNSAESMISAYERDFSICEIDTESIPSIMLVIFSYLAKNKHSQAKEIFRKHQNLIHTEEDLELLKRFFN